MGEMADFALEEVEDFEDMRERWVRGEISDVEAYELGIVDEFGADMSKSRPTP